MVLDTREIKKKLKQIKGIVPTKADSDTLMGVLIADNKLHVNNLTMGVSSNLTVDSDESYFLPQQAVDTIMTFPVGEVEITSNANNKLILKTEGIKSTFQSFPPSLFERKRRGGRVSEVKVESADFIFALQFVIRAVAEHGTNAAHQGVLVEVDRDKLNLVGLDGYRLQHAEINYTVPCDSRDDFRTIIPKDVVKKIINLGLKGELLIESDDRHANFITEDYEVTTATFGGEYFQYWTPFEAEGTEVQVDRKLLTKAINRAVLSMEKSVRSPLRIEINDGIMMVSIVSSKADYEEEFEVQAPDGYTLVIGFEASYMQEMLLSRSETTLTFQFGKPESPVIVRGEGCRSLVLPLRLKGG